MLKPIILIILGCTSIASFMVAQTLEDKRKIYHANRLNWPNVEGKMELVEETDEYKFFIWDLEGRLSICLGSDSTFRYEENIEGTTYYSSGNWEILNDSSIMLKSNPPKETFSTQSFFFNTRFVNLNKVYLFKNGDLYITEP